MEDYIQRVSWAQVGDYLNGIAQRVDPHDFSGVFGIPRGGLVLAAWLSHKLYLPLLSAPCKNCIIVDDISDSGDTLEHYAKHTGHRYEDMNYFLTTMFYRPNNKEVKPDYYFREKGDKWIVFPWEE